MGVPLVEDEPKTAVYVLAGLRGAGHEIAAAADGRSRLFKATDRTWDLLIVDRLLPELDGLALVRTLPAGKIETPVLFLSGVGDRASRQWRRLSCEAVRFRRVGRSGGSARAPLPAIGPELTKVPSGTHKA